MPEVHCPIPGCEYKNPDVDATVVVELIKAHIAIHLTVAAAVVKVDRVRRPRHYERLGLLSIALELLCSSNKNRGT